MYGTGSGLPATGAMGAMVGAAHTSSVLLALFAGLMMLSSVYIVVRNIFRRRANQRP